MSNLVISQAKKLAETFGMGGDERELVDVLKATAFRGPVSAFRNVIRQIGHVRVKVSRIQLQQAFADALMQAPPPDGIQLFIQSLRGFCRA